MDAPEDCDAAAFPQQLLLQVLKLLVRHSRLAIVVESLQALLAVSGSCCSVSYT
jgi:hypothetical protein